MNDIQAVLNNLVTAVKTGAAEQAHSCLQQLLEHQPNLQNNWLGVARMAILSGNVDYAKQALAQLDNNKQIALPDKLQYCAMLIEVGQIQHAFQVAQALEQVNPGAPEICHFLSTVALQLGFAEQAQQYAELVLKKWPMSGQTWLVLISATKVQSTDAIIERLLQAEQVVNSSNNPQSIASYYAAVSKMYVDLNDHHNAFQFAEKSSATMLKAENYQPKEELQNIRFIHAQFNNNQAETSAEKRADENNPIFIIGLPRSGTSLLEQILCSHSKIVDGGEFNGMGRAARVLTKGQPIGSRAEQFDEMKVKDNIPAIRQAYLNYAHQRFGKGGVVVDKSLSNNRYIWLIKQVFPQSPIIYIQRDILDSAWSCYRTHFSNGFKWSNSLTNIGAHFALEENLTDLWLELFPSTIFSLKYEQLVIEPEQKLTELLAFCGLEYESEILDYYKNKRPVYTASVAQVREKIHQQAVGPSAQIKQLLTPFMDEYKKLKK